MSAGASWPPATLRPQMGVRKFPVVALPARPIDMCSTLAHVHHMAIMVQIRNVPETLHRQLKSRAALAGMSLSDYLLNEIRELAQRPTLDELRSRLQRRAAVEPDLSPADAVRAERDRP